MRSFIGLPNMDMAGNIFVAGSGVLLYRSMASWKVSMSISPFSVTFPVISRLMVFTPISALQLLWGNATELRRWCNPQWRWKSLVVWAVNSGPPSDDSSSGIP